MNREMKRVSGLVLAMFLTLLVSTSILQVFQADNLNANDRNTRTLYDSYSRQRGPILVGGQPIAQSVPTTDKYKFQRTYSNGPLYSSVTGYFTQNQGSTGIEAALDQKLSGTSSTQFLNNLNSLVTGKNPQGDSVEVTIDPVAQQAAYDALGDKQGAVVLLEPKTGRVLAMVSKPDFDPNQLAMHDTEQVIKNYTTLLDAAGDPLINRTINGNMDPPGSSFKPVVTTAALSSGKYTKDSQLPNPSALTLPGTNTQIHNAWFGTCGAGDTASIETAQVLSCNIPFAELGMQLGSRTIREQAEKFGFNQRLSIPLKVSPSVYKSTADPAQLAMSSFGQFDDRATPLQMAMVSAAIANQGKLMYPNLVDSIRTADLKQEQGFQPKELSQATSPEVAATIAQMMVTGVNNGAASNARIDGVSVGGKTGTAQNGPTDPYTLWFTGFAPAESPRFAVAVVVQNGGGLGQNGDGNTVAAPIAKKVLEAVLNK